VIIRRINKISPHAIDRMRERVIPWARWTDERVEDAIRLLVVDRDHRIRGRLQDRVTLQNSRLRFVYCISDGRVVTVLPFRRVSEREWEWFVAYQQGEVYRDYSPAQAGV
jgi:hypothetical protein